MMSMRILSLAAIVVVGTVAGMSAPRTIAAQQSNALSAAGDVMRSDSASRRDLDGGVSKTGKRGNPGDAGPASAEPVRTLLRPVTVIGKPGSLEVVGLQVPASLPRSEVIRYHIVPVAGARIFGATEGTLPGGSSRPASLLITVSAPASAPAGRIRVASAQFEGPIGTQPLEIPIEMTVLAVRRVELTIIDQLVGARRGEVTTIRYRAVNFGNQADSITLGVELPAGWRLSSSEKRVIALPVRGAREGVIRVWVPPQANSGTSTVRIVANSNRQILSAAEVRVELETPGSPGSQFGPRFSLGTAVSGLTGGVPASAYVASLEGALADSVTISARGSWRPDAPARGSSDEYAFSRLGVPTTAPSLALISPRLELGLGLTNATLSDLSGAFVTGSGVAAGTRIGSWKISGLEGRPYTYGIDRSDSASQGSLASARIDRDGENTKLSVIASHLSDAADARRLDALSVGGSFQNESFGNLSSEIGYRRFDGGEGLGWSAEVRRQSTDGSLSVRAIHAPGGARAFARATDDLNAAGSRRIADWMSLSGGYWRSGDGSGTLGSSTGDGWNFGPTFSIRSLGTSLGLQGRGSTLSVSGESGRFGSSETQAAALLDVRNGGTFLTGIASIGQTGRTVSSADQALPSLNGTSAELRGSIGMRVLMGTAELDASTQNYSGPAGILPGRSAISLRLDHIAIPVTERMRVYAGAVVERMAFSAGNSSPLSSRFSLGIPLGFGFDITAVAEHNPFLFGSSAGGHGTWMTALRIDRTQYLPRLTSSGETRIVYRDLDGNGIRSRGEAGIGGVVVHCGSRTLVTDAQGRFKCDALDRSDVDYQSLPMGWMAPAIRRDQVATRDIGLVMVAAVHVHVDLAAVDTFKLAAGDIEKLVVVARDTAAQPWLARYVGNNEFVFDAMPPGQYKIDVDASGIEEPLFQRGRPEFVVGQRTTSDVRVTLAGRAMKMRVLPPAQNNLDGPGTDGTAKPRASNRTTSKENRR